MSLKCSVSAVPALVVALVLGASGMAGAATLDKAACEKLKAEEAALVKEGVKSDLDRGSENGKANLQPARLEQVKRLIAVEEDLKFRCRHGPVPVGDDDSTEPAANADPAAKKKPVVKAKAVEANGEAPKPKTKPAAAKAKSAEASPAGEEGAVAPKPKPKAKAKPKPAPASDADDN